MSGATDPSNAADAQQGQGAMTVRGAAFLGVGSMVGAGIFALLGEAGAVAGAAVWLSFLIAGIVATLQGYAVAKLGARYPSSGGIVTFLLQGFGRGTSPRSPRGCSTSQRSSSPRWCRSRSATMAPHFSSGRPTPGWSKVLATAVVLAVAVVNIAGARFIDRVQSTIVIVLLAVFAVFIVVTLTQVDPELSPPRPIRPQST